MIRNWIIKLLFRLIGEGHELYEIASLFNREKRKEMKKRKEFWRKGLRQAHKNKGLLDWLHYQSEADKERFWRGKSNPDVVRGTRIRTLYLVHQMQMADEEDRISDTQTVEGEKKQKGFLNKLQQEFKQITNI